MDRAGSCSDRSSRAAYRAALPDLTSKYEPSPAPSRGGFSFAHRSPVEMVTFSGERTMRRRKPPFRADMVGSILRTAPLKEARSKYLDGAISAPELKQIEDREIEKILKRQSDVGLQLATDGEFRRAWWHFDFLKFLDGVELYDTKA